MDKIRKKYYSLVKKFHKLETDISEHGIHEKRVILSKLIPIISVQKTKNINHRKKIFSLMGKLRNIQIQILIMKSTETYPGISDYITYLDKKELKFGHKIRKFFKKHKIVFPKITLEQNICIARIISQTVHSYNKIKHIVLSNNEYNAVTMHKIRKELKVFRYGIETISLEKSIDDEVFDQLKEYQDKLGEIQDYRILIENINVYKRKKRCVNPVNTTEFDIYLKKLIDNFSSDIDAFLSVCEQTTRIAVE